MRRIAWSALLLAAGAGAQTTPAEDPRLQRGGTFTEPPARVDPVYLPDARRAPVYTEDAPASAAFDAARLELLLGLDVPLRKGGGTGFAAQGAKSASPALLAQLRWQPFDDPAWFVQGTFHRYLDRSEEQPWNPHYSYSFGYDDGEPGHWSLAYANYTGTRLHPDPALNQGRANFSQGVWALAYRFRLPEQLAPLFLVGDGDDAICKAGAQLTPRYADLASSTLRRNRGALTLGCRYTRPGGWFAEVTLFAYPDPGKQQPWDPDFTYAFGIADWRAGTLSVQYNNYSGNRFPGRARGAGEGTPRSGSLALWWRLGW